MVCLFVCFFKTPFFGREFQKITVLRRPVLKQQNHQRGRPLGSGIVDRHVPSITELFRAVNFS